MVGAKINGMIVPIDRVPQNGEIIEILTSSSSKGPSRDWLKIVKTSEARTKIRQWFKKEKRSENILVGKSAIDGEFKRYAYAITDAQKNEILTNVASRIGFNSVDDLYNTLGYGGLPLSKITFKLKDEFDRVVKTEMEEEIITDTAQVKVADKPNNIKSDSGIVIDGEYGCMVKFAKCCNPLPGDSVVGFVTKGYGISIHKADCPNVVEGMQNPANSDRWVEAHWELPVAGSRTSVYEALVQIHAYNTITLIADITGALADMKVSILQINSQKRSNERIIINLKISCKNIEHYKSIVSRLKDLSGVESVSRGFS